MLGDRSARGIDVLRGLHANALDVFGDALDQVGQNLSCTDFDEQSNPIREHSFD